MTGKAPPVPPVSRLVPAPVALPTFAHASEAELARILDFYQVRWLYEPHVFPILWSLDGDVAESFSPDFYLPDLDLYVELTTLRQPLVRKKNRKLRRLRELYPDIRIKLFYARDFRALMLKYGKFGLLNALSGTPGQVVALPAIRDHDQVHEPAALGGPDLDALEADAAIPIPVDISPAPLAELVPLHARRRALRPVQPLRPRPRARSARDG